MFKFAVGEEVEIKMTFAVTLPGTTDAPGFRAKVSKREKVDGERRYKLIGFSGWWPESILFKI